MIRAHWATLCALLALPAYAAEQAGMVKVANGQVRVERAGKKLPAEVGSLIEVTDRIRTGADGSVGVTLRNKPCCRPARIH